jgi:hypothetical protein
MMLFSYLWFVNQVVTNTPYFSPIPHRILRTAVLLSLLLISLLPAVAQPYMFQINDFKAFSENISLGGAAMVVNETLRLTPDKANQSGACWYKSQKIDFENGFETEFTFLISSSNTTALPGDGFAFVIQAQSDVISGGNGNNIGYKQIPFGVALEFDTKDDNEGSRNHINLSFYNPETKSYRSYATVHEIPEITDGKPHFTRIVYRDGRLQIYLDSYLFPVLSVKLDIAEKIKSADHTAWLGFTSSTSDQYANHDLLAWSIKEFAPQPEDIAADSVKVLEKGAIQVQKRKLTISVWDHNTVDGDIVSLKLGPEWILTKYELTEKKHVLQATLLGFSEELILFAHNVGMVPPNTVTVSVYDGVTTQRFSLESNLESSESFRLVYAGDDEGK